VEREDKHRDREKWVEDAIDAKKDAKKLGDTGRGR